MTETETITEEPTEIEMREALTEITPSELEMLRQLMIVAKGGNPEAEQTLTDMLKLPSPIAKTNLPTRKDVQRMIYCEYASGHFSPYFIDKDNNPFSRAVDAICLGFSAKGGWIVRQIVELLRQQQDLSSLETMISEQQSKGFFAGLRRGGSTE